MQLTNRKVVVSNKVQTFAERIYLPAIAKGMIITASHLFKKSPTIMYPEQTRPIAPVYRGQHVLKRDENGAERCTSCGMCAVACPAEAITMEIHKKGSAVVGTYIFEIAEQKAVETTKLSRANGFPLQTTIEKE